VFGQHLQQPIEPGRVIADACASQHQTIKVDQRDVVVAFRPVDSTGNPHPHPFIERLRELRVCTVPSWTALMARHLTSRLQTQQLAGAAVYMKTWNGRRYLSSHPASSSTCTLPDTSRVPRTTR
jgi:hypothetical protein